MKEYEVSVSVEKVIVRTVLANSEEEAIEIVNQRLMNSPEDFACILASHAEEVTE